MAGFDLDGEKRKAEKEFMKTLSFCCLSNQENFRAELPKHHFVNEVGAHAWLEYLELDMENNTRHHHHLPLKKLFKAAKSVSSANRKLISFERGC